MLTALVDEDRTLVLSPRRNVGGVETACYQDDEPRCIESFAVQGLHSSNPSTSLAFHCCYPTFTLGNTNHIL